MDNMIILSPTASEEVDRCPNCNKEENIVQVCKHCKYVYPEEKFTDVTEPHWFVKSVALVVFIAIIWIIITIMGWLIECRMGHNLTLVGAFTNQWHFICNLRIW